MKKILFASLVWMLFFVHMFYLAAVGLGATIFLMSENLWLGILLTLPIFPVMAVNVKALDFYTKYIFI